MTPTKKQYYKYRPLYQVGAGGVREPHPFTMSLFKRAEIFFAAPKDFNDPFDCNLRLHANGCTDAEWVAYFDSLIAQYPANKPVLEQAKAGKYWITKPEIKESLGLNQHRNHNENSSVFCLSKNANSIQMFSYYADSHRGITIEFSFSDREIPCGIPFGDANDPDTWYERKVIFRDVEYPPTMPELNYLKLYGSDQLLRSLLFTKHRKWAHEEEFRIFRRNVPPSAVRFDKALITRVILGCKTGSDDVALVRDCLSGWPTDVVLSKAELASDDFNLHIREIETVKGS